MRKSVSAIVIASAFSLGGCAMGMGGPLEAVLGSVLGGSQGQNSGGNFQQAAVQACGNHASQYGQVQVRDVRQQDSQTLRVYGTVSSNYQNRNFECSFRSDGRITDFDF